MATKDELINDAKKTEQEMMEALENNDSVINDDDLIGTYETDKPKPITSGSYDAKITDIEVGESKSGKKMLTLTYEILGPTNKGFKPKQWVVLEGDKIFSVTQLGRAFGFPNISSDPTKEAYKLTKSGLLNKLCVIKLEAEYDADTERTNTNIKSVSKMKDEAKNAYLGISLD